jgi:hypothetical protein
MLSKLGYIMGYEPREAYNDQHNKFEHVKPNIMRDTAVRKINCMRSEFRKQLKKVRNSIRSGASAYEVHESALWYFKERFHFLFPDLSRDKPNVK